MIKKYIWSRPCYLYLYNKIYFLFRSLPGVQVAAAAAYGVPGQTTNGTAASATGLTSQQAALAAQAAQGAALAQQQGVMMQAAYPASAVQQFQVNGQPTTIAL